MRQRDVLDIARGRSLAASGEGRAIRERARLSAAEVAGVVGVTASAVQHWERGVRIPSGRVAAKYARVLDSLAEQVAP